MVVFMPSILAQSTPSKMVFPKPDISIDEDQKADVAKRRTR